MILSFHTLGLFRRAGHRLAFIAAWSLLTVSANIARAESLTLDACIARALAGNPSLRAAEREVEAARARLRQAGAIEAPSLSYAVGKLGTPVSGEEHDASLRVSQDLPAPGARGGERAIARIDVLIAEAARESFALKLRGDVARSYHRLQADALGTRTLESLRRTAEDLEQMVTTRLRTGGARYLDVLRARSERVRIANDVIEAERALREDRRGLTLLMGVRYDDSLSAADTLAYAPFDDSLDRVVEAAMDNRPRLRAARLEVERGEAEVALQHNGRRPSASLSAGLDRVPGSERPGLGGEVTFSLPFLPWTDRRSRIAEARATQGGAQTRLAAAEREVDATLRNAFESARSAEQQVQQFDRVLLADAADAIRTATQNYQAGQIDALELFETLRTYRTIELEHIRALLNYKLALTDLAVAE